MRLDVLVPERTVLAADADKVIAQTSQGAFCLLPRHVDFVATLVPGVLVYFERGAEVFLALDEGILVKQGQHVSVSTRRAMRGDDLADLQRIVEQEFRQRSEHEQHVRTVLARFEAGVMRGFLDLQ